MKIIGDGCMVERGRFAGRTVIVTGGGTGMGRAAAIKLGREGANVVLVGRRLSELNLVANEIRAQGGTALEIATDVSKSDDVEAMVDTVLRHYGRLDLAWNNAGVLGGFSPIQETSVQEFDQVIATNLRGVFACLKYEVAAMIAAGTKGAIVNTSSWTAHGAMPGISAYSASKGALDALMRTVALEVGSFGIRINNVSPGIIATPMSEAALGDPTAMRPFIRHTPLQRVGLAEEVADTVLWLLSEDSRFVTGQSILVDGGFTLGGPRPWLNDIVARHA